VSRKGKATLKRSASPEPLPDRCPCGIALPDPSHPVDLARRNEIESRRDGG
jgi:hypothetical protein